ncbi:hypothetical protein E4T47_08337 [Aureobasidium subglaciale]|nr:hypothetical protein E4T47_08337 [Aureobasidium subglaciale]
MEVAQPTPPNMLAPDLPPPYNNTTMGRNNAFYREDLVDGRKEYYYGTSDPGGSKPEAFFVCKRVTKASEQVMKRLLKHQTVLHNNCHCDFEYLKTGKTKRDTSRLCGWIPGKTGKEVLKQMNKHDQKCACGAFDFSRGLN